MTPGILTHSGRVVSPTSGVPSLSDIGNALARMPRFAGHTRRPWTVAHHSLVVAEIMVPRRYNAMGTDAASDRARAAGLLHDAHEAVTGDVPTPFKTDALRTVQQLLDGRIMDAYYPGGYIAYDELHATIERADREALLAEAYIVGPPSIETPEDVREHFGDIPGAVALCSVRRVLELDGADIGAAWIRAVRRCHAWPDAGGIVQ